MKNKRTNNAVTEVLGTAMLLGMAVVLFSALQIIVFAYPFEPSAPSVNLVGTMDGDNVTIEHHGGESLSLDTELLLTICGTNEPIITAGNYLDSNTSNGDQLWNIGEKVSYTPSVAVTGCHVEVTVVDVETNSVVMRGTIQRGSS